jgi:hypothetical protein
MITLIRRCYGGSRVMWCESRFGYIDNLSFLEFNAYLSYVPAEAYARYS